jgi:hypothetical protein
MKNWQAFVNDHIKMEVIDENTIKVFNASWKPETLEFFDDVVNRNTDGSYTVQTFSQIMNTLDSTENFESIRDYLGY